MKNCRNAITFVELVVVVFTITLLTSVLLPVLGAVRENGEYKAICAENERQILAAINDYASDNEDYYPLYGCEPSYDYDISTSDECDDGTEMLLLQSDYLETPEVFYCPADQEFGDNGSVIRNEDNARSYSFNLGWGDWGNTEYPYEGTIGFKMATGVHKPDRTVLISEIHNLWNILYERNFSGYYGPLPPNRKTTGGRISGYNPDRVGGREIYYWNDDWEFAHGEGLNFGFADGHVEYVEPDIENEYPRFWWFDNGLYPYAWWYYPGQGD